jgi:cytochrome c biogenesis protein CcmG/thiol:disulfide interchange protein DsbE
MQRPLVPIAAACATAALVLGACGGMRDDSGGSADVAPSSVKAAPPAPKLPADAPAALRANAADANRVVGEGTAALKARLAKLSGHPVVVNQWASWCGPCRAEFPYFARSVARHGARVAFVGVDALDGRGAAEQFIDEQPPGFASIFDPDGDATRFLGGGRGAPMTVFIDAGGRTDHRKLGGYQSAAALDADIRRYALEAT